MTIARSFIFIFLVTLYASCSFDYGSEDTSETTEPDIVFDELDYVRVRNGATQARFQAEQASRYEKRRVMELKKLNFEQYNSATGEIDAQGSAGAAEVELASGNVRLKDGIDISVESEDLTIETTQLEWKDTDRKLVGGEGELVTIKNQSGRTDFRGKTFSANVRSRDWEFAEGADGAFEQDEENEEDEAALDMEGEEVAGEQ